MNVFAETHEWVWRWVPDYETTRRAVNRMNEYLAAHREGHQGRAVLMDAETEILTVDGLRPVRFMEILVEGFNGEMFGWPGWLPNEADVESEGPNCITAYSETFSETVRELLKIASEECSDFLEPQLERA